MFSRLNPTLRGFLVIALIALVVVVFQLYTTLAVVGGLLRIAFFLAIAFVIFLWWKSRRADIEAWSDRSRLTFYAAAILIVIDLGAYFSPFRVAPLAGFSALSFILVLAICGYAMWRVWRDEHHYG